MRRFLAISFVGTLAFAGVACDSGSSDTKATDEDAVVDEENGEEGGEENGEEGGNGAPSGDARAYCDLIAELDETYEFTDDLDEFPVPTEAELRAVVNAAPPEIRSDAEVVAAWIVEQGPDAFLAEPPAEVIEAGDRLTEWENANCA
jgi:hypothetical protein